MVKVIIGSIFVLAVCQPLIEHIEGHEGDFSLEGRFDSIAKAGLSGGGTPCHSDKEWFDGVMLVVLCLSA